MRPRLPHTLVLAAPLLALAIGPATASTAAVSATRATTAACHAGVRAPGGAVRTTNYTAPRTGLVRTTLSSTRGDWDVAVFDADSGRLVGAGAAPATSDLAEGFVAAGERLVVQACRRAGAATRAQLRTQTIELAPQATAAVPERVVRVTTPDRAARRRLAALGLDPAERADVGSVDVVLPVGADRLSRPHQRIPRSMGHAEVQTAAPATRPGVGVP